jgi:putative membrane protein
MDTNDPKEPQTGERPDYRFSLANERTFLAWTRTSLTFVAGGLAVHQFASALGNETSRTGVSLALVAIGGILGASAYYRWRGIEHAMRHQLDLPRSMLLPLLGILMPLLAAGLIVLLVV